jgi:hypothetical protein
MTLLVWKAGRRKETGWKRWRGYRVKRSEGEELEGIEYIELHVKYMQHYNYMYN